jgi:hypothetical protein
MRALSFGVEVFCPSRCKSFYHNGSRVRKEILVSDCYPLSYRRQRVATKHALTAAPRSLEAMNRAAFGTVLAKVFSRKGAKMRRRLVEYGTMKAMKSMEGGSR